MNLKVSFIIMLLLCSSAFANSHWRIGADFTVEVDNKGIGQESVITILTDIEKDLTVSVRSGKGETALRTVLRPSQDGVYNFPIVFDHTGEWGIWMRYGMGLETYERIKRFDIQDRVEGIGLSSSTFRGYSFRPDVPNYVQPMGYAIFGTLLLCTLLMLARLFYWLNNKHRKLNI